MNRRPYLLEVLSWIAGIASAGVAIHLYVRQLASEPPSPSPSAQTAPPTSRPASAASIAPSAPTPVTTSQRAPAVEYFVQVGSFTQKRDALDMAWNVNRDALMQAQVYERTMDGRDVFVARVGPFGSRQEADDALSKLERLRFKALLVTVHN